ncbi:hypothetical protein ERJ75_000770800 [Trypanosoma vivax]|uniref:Legume-like lectin n=1 Tax=Trypanosoma vivax (strain Y486) TaxID=1055687 RepID=G0U3M3_TRYVY|nr:hypothetical protein TRVL_05233 [Trypanosoma vivax]KAH8613945.1 hypothetical protein ERJ75_000770800 [Trypanosoma vivax]CCC50880.1 conserved hypothetical protein [Trypanosoma vivax Y486]
MNLLLVRCEARLRQLLIFCLILLPTWLADAANPTFPSNFYVNTGITIPFPLYGAVSQSGFIYSSNSSGQLRIDNFFMGNRLTFLADIGLRRGYVIEDGAGSSYKAARSSCRSFKMGGGVVAFGVPERFVKHAEPTLVRGVEVVHYSGFDRDRSGPLQEVHYFVRNMTVRPLPKSQATRGGSVFTLPWRVQTKRSGRALREVAGAPTTLPNWRYFGGPFLDEVAVLVGSYAAHLERLMWDTSVTVDFYNFVPEAPDPSVFAVPANCEEVNAQSAGGDVDISLAQRLLVDLSFYTTEGRQLLQEKSATEAGPTRHA